MSPHRKTGRVNPAPTDENTSPVSFQLTRQTADLFRISARIANKTHEEFLWELLNHHGLTDEEILAGLGRVPDKKKPKK